MKEGEWTGMTVANISAGCVHITPVLRERIADAHNAALAEVNDIWDRASRQADTLAEYLADVKGDLYVALDALKQISDEKRHGESAWRIATNALSNIGAK